MPTTTVNASKSEIPTIDCSMVTILPVGATAEIGFTTSSKVAIEPQTEEQDAVKLIIKGVLKAQKKKVVTVTGNQITLTDNLFNPELVKILQGGTIVYDQTDVNKIVSYTPPVAGSTDHGTEFTLKCYSAQYDASGDIVNYECISYPHCTGRPVGLNSEDNVFRVPEYTIDSAPDNGEAPYVITYVDTLPTLVAA